MTVPGGTICLSHSCAPVTFVAASLRLTSGARGDVSLMSTSRGLLQCSLEQSLLALAPPTSSSVQEAGYRPMGNIDTLKMLNELSSET